jgi:hypothetical protein
MNQDLQKYLDGELPIDALSPEDRREAEQWTAMLDRTAPLRSVKAPSWLETRVMATLPAQPNRSGVRRALLWLIHPQPIRVRPISVGLLAAAAAFVLFLARPGSESITPQSGVGAAGNVHAVTAGQPTVIYVQFVFANSAARTVTVAGDFNGWDIMATPLTDTDGDGIWTGHIALRPGLHKYMFVVDGEDWVTDPQADTYVDDGFGMRNAVVTVAQPAGRTI